MIGSLAQGALLMGVVYWYSKYMFSMINDYYREEFKKNVIQQTPENNQNSIQENELIKKNMDNNEIKTNIIPPTTPTMEGLPDILNENSIVHNDEKIITRGSRDTLNCKLTFDIQQSDSDEKESLSTDDDCNTQNIRKFEKKQIKINRGTLIGNLDSKVEIVEENVCTQINKKYENLLKSQQFNNDHRHQDLNLPSVSSLSAIDAENEKIGKIKHELYMVYDEQVMNKNNNQNDDIVTVDFNKATTILNPSTSTKLNYATNRNDYIPPINDANNWCKGIQYDGERIDGKYNRKLPINQLHDKNKFNNNMNIGSSSCKININSKPPLCKYNKNKIDATGNYCSSSDKIEKKIATSNLDVSTLQRKSINSHSINNNLKEITNSKSYNDINRSQTTNHDNEMKFCRRKSVSEYIAFWSNMQP